MEIQNIDDVSIFRAQEHNDAIVKVIGVGGGGGNAVEYMYRQGVDHVSFAVCNTDKIALERSSVPTKIVLGKGLGAGDIPEMAKSCAEDSIDKIDALFDDKTEMVFVTATMGGGTGTGAASTVARIAKRRGLLTIGVITIPFRFEGQTKLQKALYWAEEMRKDVDALIVIDNERLIEYSSSELVTGFYKTNEVLATAVKSVVELMYCEAFIRLDFQDINTTLSGSRSAIISNGYGEGEKRVREAIDTAISSPLLKDRDITSSKRLLFNLYISRQAEHKVTMGEIAEFREFVESLNENVKVIWGIGYDDSLGDRVKMTILASGFELSEIVEEKKMRATPKLLKPEEMDDDQTIGVMERSPLSRSKKSTNDGRFEIEFN